MSDIDKKIQQALNHEDQKILDQFGSDPGPIGMALQTFRGGQWWFTAGIWVFGLVVFGLLVLCTLNYFNSDELDARLTWGITMLFCGLGLVIVKIGAWQQMQTQLLLREVKRLELRWMTSQASAD